MRPQDQFRVSPAIGAQREDGGLRVLAGLDHGLRRAPLHVELADGIEETAQGLHVGRDGHILELPGARARPEDQMLLSRERDDRDPWSTEQRLGHLGLLCL